MATYTENNETRLIFSLARDTATAERAVALPGVPGEGEEATRVLEAFGEFRDAYLNSREPASGGSATLPADFFQPTSWRDAIGSLSGTLVSPEMRDDNPWTTTDVELEFYKVTRTRYGADDLEP